jgi:hypothetical protein
VAQEEQVNMKLHRHIYYTHDSTDLIIYIHRAEQYGDKLKCRGLLYAKPNGYFVEFCNFVNPDTTGWKAYRALEEALGCK